MKKINRIDLADFDSPEQIIQGIINLVPDLPIPVPVDDLARMLDITEIQALETQGFEGGLLTDINKSEGIILFNQASPFQRRRFTIGHELAHFLCPRHIPQGDNGFFCSFDDMRLISARAADRAATMEVEANRFAASLLMPLPHFRKDLRLHVGADIEYILELARRYDTSKEATARRYVDVQDEPCAAVVSHRGSILRFYRGDDFPFIDLNPGDRVPGESLTAKTDLKLGVVSDQEERDGSLWLSVRHGRRAPTIYEQVLPQRDGFRLTLITLAEDPEEVKEEEDLEESWTPRFKR